MRTRDVSLQTMPAGACVIVYKYV